LDARVAEKLFYFPAELNISAINVSVGKATKKGAAMNLTKEQKRFQEIKRREKAVAIMRNELQKKNPEMTEKQAHAIAVANVNLRSK